jgi:hypothetical protein
MRRGKLRASPTVYSDDYEAARALLLQVGALRQESDDTIVDGHCQWKEAYILGACRILEGALKIEKWTHPRAEFALIVEAEFDDLSPSQRAKFSDPSS